MSRIYVKQVVIEGSNFKNTEALIDEAILKETKTGAVFKTVSSFADQGVLFHLLVFERT